MVTAAEAGRHIGVLTETYIAGRRVIANKIEVESNGRDNDYDSSPISQYSLEKK